jgi:hypothetical protein
VLHYDLHKGAAFIGVISPRPSEKSRDLIDRPSALPRSVNGLTEIRPTTPNVADVE